MRRVNPVLQPAVRPPHRERFRMDTSQIKQLIWLLIICFSNVISGLPTDDTKRASIRKATRVNLLRDGLPASRLSSGDGFPEELEFDLVVDGEEPVRSRSRKVPEPKPMPSFDSSGREHTRDRKKQQFYVGEAGSYQVSASARTDGYMDTDIKAMYKNDHGEKCFYARGESHCWRIGGEGSYATIPLEDDAIDTMPTENESRAKRTVDDPLVYTDFNITRVLKIVYVVDKPFMDWFRDLSGDDTTAIEDAEDYIYMTNNEVTYFLRGIKELTESNSSIPDLDIVAYAKGFYFPLLGTEWTWLTRWVTPTVLNAIADQTLFDEDVGGLPTFGRWVERGNLDQFGPFDTATLITPRVVGIRGLSRLGVAYLATTCNPSFPDKTVSFVSDGFAEISRTIVHEMGHGLSCRHDGAFGLEDCPIGTNIMSPFQFDPDESKKDTFNRWSICSVRQMISHLSIYPSCLEDRSISNDDFYEQLCIGNRPANQFDIDYQCKASLRDQGSVACSPNETVTMGKVPAEACWRSFLVNCTNANGECLDRIFRLFDGTRCDGSDSTKEYVCYRGDCLEKVDVCAGRPTAPPVCSCRGPSRIGCCLTERNQDDSCCFGCRRSIFGTGCVTDWTMTN